jgi:hypothetical protein
MNGANTSSPMLSVYDGRTCVGFLLPRGKGGVEASDAHTKSLGLFPSQGAAVAAISARVDGRSAS